MEKRGSDHRPVLIKLLEAQESYRGWFKFDRRLLEVEGVRDNVINAWNFGGTNSNGSLSNRLKACRKSLSRFKKQVNLNARDRITQAEYALEQEQSSNRPSVSIIASLKKDLVKAYKDEETYWWQKSKDKWLHGGDRNTRFFHNSIKASRARNTIEKLANANGVEVFSEAAKGEVAVEFYTNLFKSSNPPPMNSWFHGMTPRVTENMNAQLTSPVSAAEVKAAVFSINPTKAPGPDGMSGLFFQKYWPVMEEQVVREVQMFFETGVLPKEWNYTHLCLIPKVPEPQTISDLRPISLCSVIYKIVSKVMVKRLQKWMPQLVFSTQTACLGETDHR